MSGFDDLLIHPLVLVKTNRSFAEGDLDDMGQPTVTTTVVTPFRGRVYARTVREVAESVQAGAGISDHTIRCRPGIDPLGVDYIAHASPADHTIEDPDDDRRYQVQGVAARNEAHGVHHLFIDARLVTASPGQT